MSIFRKQDFTMQTRALVYTASFRIKERRRQTFKVTLCHFFISFLYFSWVSQVNGGDCPLEINPPSVVVKYGSSVSVNCSTDVTHNRIGWEASVGSVPMTTDKLITWRVSNLRRWDIRPQCYISYNRTQCSIYLPIIIYKTSHSVFINTVDHTGPMINGSQYELQCEIVNVAPIRSLTVKWFKGETEVHSVTITETIKTPVNVTSTLEITADRDDDGAQYRCEAELELGADGPQPPPTVTSEPLNITVYYRPKHEVTNELISTNDGDVNLNCTVAANPPATYSWSSEHLAEPRTSSVLSSSTLTAGKYTCTATNPLGQSSKVFIITERPQFVKVGNNTSSVISLSTGSPQGCVLSPLLFTMMTHDCCARYSTNHIIKYADDTTVVGLISDNNELAYREEVKHLVRWCDTNNLILNVDKTREIIVDFRKKQPSHSPLLIKNAIVEQVSSIKFLGVQITDTLTWSLNISALVKRAQQRLYFLRRMRRANIPPHILTTFYRGTIESILTSCISVWFGSCNVSEWKCVQRVVRTAEKIIGTALPLIDNTAGSRCLTRAQSIIKDPFHPNHALFSLLPSGKRFSSFKCRTTRFYNSFIPHAIRLVNSQ